MFFTISFDMLRIVFVTLADLKKCNINTATQHQLLHKTVKDFLKVAKDTLDEIEGPLRFDQESTYYMLLNSKIWDEEDALMEICGMLSAGEMTI